MTLRLLLTVVFAFSAAAEVPDLRSLGRLLFSDKRLSADRSTSCASCHDPKRAFSDGRAVSTGVYGRAGVRHAPTLIGRGRGTLQFWDGRAASLTEQVREPIQNPREMDLQLDAAVERLAAEPEYAGITQALMIDALARYVATIRSTNSPFDRFRLGDDQALTGTEREGLRLFRDKARCYVCHAGDDLTDESFHNTGVAWQGGQVRDEGRGKITGKVYHRGAFKTPTLREIRDRAPYMHDGSIRTLEEVVEYYDRGGNRNPYLDENLVPLHLTAAEKSAIVAFLRACSGSIQAGL